MWTLVWPLALSKPSLVVPFPTAVFIFWLCLAVHAVEGIAGTEHWSCTNLCHCQSVLFIACFQDVKTVSANVSTNVQLSILNVSGGFSIQSGRYLKESPQYKMPYSLEKRLCVQAMPCTAAPPWWHSAMALGLTSSCWTLWVCSRQTYTHIHGMVHTDIQGFQEKQGYAPFIGCCCWFNLTWDTVH